MEVLFRSYELDTAHIIIGSYIKEDGFYMSNGVAICGKPCIRHYIQDKDNIKHEIAPEYLSINFSDMLDSDGNKIFASLSEDGRGGDNLEVEYSIRGTHDRRVRDGIAIFKSYSYAIQCKIDGELIVFNPNYFIITKVIGIQQ